MDRQWRSVTPINAVHSKLVDCHYTILTERNATSQHIAISRHEEEAGLKGADISSLISQSVVVVAVIAFIIHTIRALFKRHDD